MKSILFATCLSACIPVVVTAQGAEAGKDQGALARGWSALAAGRFDEAEAAADALVGAGRARHDATDLKIRVRVTLGRTTAALDVYESWWRSPRAEDVYLLQPIARRILEDAAASEEPSVKIAALEALAANGSRDASAVLTQLGSSGGGRIDADAALARSGSAEAIGRLENAVATGDSRRDVSAAIDALADAKATHAATAIAAALDPSRPSPTRQAAARALGLLDARSAVTTLRETLQDPDPAVRMASAAALARMGDRSGAQILSQMESSPVGDIRLLAAEATAQSSSTGPWVSIAKDVLKDPDPLVRLSAAGLLLRRSAEHTEALATLDAMLGDGNPAIRSAAAVALQDISAVSGGADLARLRHMLRDVVPQVRIAAAAALLRQAGGID